LGIAALSLSKTYDFAKLTSEISSSPSVISRFTAVFRAGISAAGLWRLTDVRPASENDSPAASGTGPALLRRFRFEACVVCDMVKSSDTFGQNSRSIDRKLGARLASARRRFRQSDTAFDHDRLQGA
jgi:hypothetical protein